jgi:phage N-6-adenine-methyltransferase
VHFRSDTHLWSTPQAFFDSLNDEFGFTIDVCALPSNVKCPAFYSPEQDGLQQVWTGSCWCNPPYGTMIGQWVQKAYESAQSGALVVCLLPARVDTRWWHDYVLPSAEVRYLKGRLKFGGCENSAPFLSAVVIFRPAASVVESEQRLLDRLRWGKWFRDELQWLLSHMPDGASPQVVAVIQEKLQDRN